MSSIDVQSDKITSGPITRMVLSLALPVVAGMFMEFALQITDYFWVGKLGAAPQDAVTTSMVVIWSMWSLLSLITVGIAAIVARYVGAKDTAKAAHFSRQGLLMSLIIGLSLAVAGYLYTPMALIFMETSEATYSHALPYLRISLLAAPLFFVIETVFSVFRASGDTRTPLKIGILFVSLNMILDPLLMFGLGPFPVLGVAGAATATAISVAVAMVVALVKVARGGVGYDLGLSVHISPKIKDMLKIGRIGLPMSLQQLVFVVVYWFLIKIVHQFGEIAGAAMGIGNRMESLSYLTCFGFSIAASTMVGQNLGAGKPDRAARCAWGALGIGIGFTFIISVMFIVFPKVISSLFTSDPRVLAIATDYLIILGLSQVTMATEIILEGAFSGAGDTVPPMLVMVPGAAARIPLAYYLCFTLGWGITGVWWTLTITTTVKAIVLAIWFQRGRWKLKEV
jgi:putative MATE family efflux protein